MTLLGTTDYRAENIEFGIKKEDKLRHVYVVGKTGTGKSTLISNMIKHDMQSNHGLALLDPHGDLVDTVIEHIPNHRINDVVLFDVADTSYPIGFNLLQYETEEEKNRIVSGVVSTFYKLYAHSR
jgi:DNA helicase HerA-like ATPase